MEQKSDTKKNPFQYEFEDQSLRSLFAKMKKTAKIRFECAHRLRRHQQFSLWTISFYSGSLIVLSVANALELDVSVSPATLNLLLVILSLLLLVVSLLVSSNNFSDKAERMHKCGLDINSLCNKALPNCKSEDDGNDVFQQFRADYDEILNAHDNHQEIDYYKLQLSMPEEYDITFKTKWLYRYLFLIDNKVYIIQILILLGVFYSVFV